MTTASITWLTAFLDSPPETSGAAESFWAAVTGTRLSPRRGPRREFATLVPDDGDAFLKVQQVVQSSPGLMHLDVHTDDVLGLAARAEVLGATTSYHELGYVVCGSPGGLTWCIVGAGGSRRPAPRRWPGGRSLVDQVCLDIPPSRWESETLFWTDLTGWERRAGSMPAFDVLVRPAGMPLRLLLQRLEDEQQTVTMHLDLAADDRDSESGRHRALGAEHVRRTDGWTTLRDPSGRSYCLTDRDVESGVCR